jgi:hypothetical protein
MYIIFFNECVIDMNLNLMKNNFVYRNGIDPICVSEREIISIVQVNIAMCG